MMQFMMHPLLPQSFLSLVYLLLFTLVVACLQATSVFYLFLPFGKLVFDIQKGNP